VTPNTNCHSAARRGRGGAGLAEERADQVGQDGKHHPERNELITTEAKMNPNAARRPFGAGADLLSTVVVGAVMQDSKTTPVVN